MVRNICDALFNTRLYFQRHHDSVRDGRQAGTSMPAYSYPDVYQKVYKLTREIDDLRAKRAASIKGPKTPVCPLAFL